jgi:hypothetical protein
LPSIIHDGSIGLGAKFEAVLAVSMRLRDNFGIRSLPRNDSLLVSLVSSKSGAASRLMRQDDCYFSIVKAVLR